eukprot:jgi/Ulvmu1/4682/UM002_0413.1
MVDWVSASLRSRGVLRVGGADCFKFLQGLITNDATRLQNDEAAPMYCAMLNNKGRQLYDLTMHRDPSESNAILLDCPAAAADRLKKLLHRYKLRTQVSIDEVSEDFSVTCAWQSGGPAQHETAIPAHLTELPADPRLNTLGRRGPVRQNDEGAACAPSTPKDDPEERYVRHRYSMGVAEGPVEIPEGTAIPLEYNLDWLNGVSFDKGCYVGQELVARTHFGGLIRKRLFPVLIDTADSIHGGANAEVFAPGKAKSIGTIRGTCGNLGLAHLRVDDAMRALQGQRPLQACIEGSRVACAPQIPFWWPQTDTVPL